MTAILHQRKIEIPYGQGDEVLELEAENLPLPEESVGILQEQDSKIHYWIQLALEYYRQGNDTAFELLLSTCLSRWDQNRVRSEASTYPDADKDRIKALDLLAIYYVRKGYQTNNRDGRREYFARAAQKFTEVDKSEILNKHGSEYQFHLLGRAYCCLIEGRNDQADAQFTFVLQQQQQSGEPDNIPSLLGRACIEFNKKEASGKRTALSLYRRALQICPNCPADVRLGLGVCFYKLNMMDKAEGAFTKALALDNNCVGALTGLAVIELNKKTQASIKRASEYLSRAFKIEPTNAMVLTLLADFFFFKKDHEKVIKLASRAKDNTENEAILAQACYQLGRAYHKQREFDKAFEFYYKATTYDGSQSYAITLAHYGVGQIYILRKEYDAATQAFETVLKTNPDNHETLKVLASLYARSPSNTKKEQARIYLKKVTENRPDDVEAWVEYASLCEQNDTQTALTAYRTSIKLYESRSAPIPPEIYNNIAALLFSTEAYEESEQYYNLALKRCEEERANNEDHYSSIVVTIQYNIGRLYEARHELIKAQETYNDIITRQSMYIDCYLRLGCMARDRGDLYFASDKIYETFRTEPDNLEAWTLVGNLHLSKLELTPAQRKFERILDKTRSNPDVYSLISVGNVWLASQYQNIRDREKLNLQRSRALLFYRSAIKYDPKNIYAANGLGCILAVKGQFNEARDVFSQVREATADFPDVWVNIAHIYVEQLQYASAVQMYENCLKKFYNNSNTDILLYMARALFKANKLADCKKVLLRARSICPYDLNILFNLAKVLKTLARQIFEDQKSTYHTVVQAEYELKMASQYFEHHAKVKIDTKSENDKSFIDLETIQLEARDCKDLLIQVDKSIKVDAELRDREETLRRKEHEEQLKNELARKAEEEEKKMAEEKQKKEELENKRRELLKRQEEAKQKLLQEGGTIHDDGSDDGSRRKKSRGKKRDGPDKERDRVEKERQPSETNKKYKSRAYLPSSSSSSSEDEDDNPSQAHTAQPVPTGAGGDDDYGDDNEDSNSSKSSEEEEDEE